MRCAFSYDEKLNISSVTFLLKKQESKSNHGEISHKPKQRDACKITGQDSSEMSRSGKPKIMELFQIKGDSGLNLIPEKLQ